MLLCLIYLSLSQKFKTQVIKENKNISLHITICIPHHLNPYTLLGHLCSLFGINFHIPSLSSEHSLLYFMIYLNRSRKAGSRCVPWSPLKWHWLFPHTMLILWTQETMTGALLTCYCFSRSFQSSLETSTYFAAYAIRQNYLLLFLLQPFHDLSVIQLIKAFKLLAHGHYSCQLFCHNSCQYSWWHQQPCRWSIQQPVLPETCPLYLKWCLQWIHLSHLLSQFNSRSHHYL